MGHRDSRGMVSPTAGHCSRDPCSCRGPRARAQSWSLPRQHCATRRREHTPQYVLPEYNTSLWLHPTMPTHCRVPRHLGARGSKRCAVGQALGTPCPGHARAAGRNTAAGQELQTGQPAAVPEKMWLGHPCLLEPCQTSKSGPVWRQICLQRVVTGSCSGTGPRRAGGVARGAAPPSSNPSRALKTSRLGKEMRCLPAASLAAAGLVPGSASPRGRRALGAALLPAVSSALNHKALAGLAARRGPPGRAGPASWAG